MSTIQMLRALVHQRLTAAVDEIIELFERAITEYEGELSCLQHKNVGLCRGARAVLNPEVCLHRIDVQQLSVQQERSQEEPQPPHVKEEQGGLGQEVEQQLQGLEEADDDDATKLPCSLVLVKMENDEDKTLYQGCSSSTGQTNTETRNFDTGRVSQPGRDEDEASDRSEPGSEVRESDWKEAAKAQSENNDILLSSVGIKTGKKSYSCSQCGARYTSEGYLKRHMMRIHTERKMYNCAVCLKSFDQSGNLKKHMRIHRDVKPYVCSFCGKKWYQRDDLTKHTRIHTGEKPYVCSLCGKTFTVSSNLKVHIRRHCKQNLNRIV